MGAGQGRYISSSMNPHNFGPPGIDGLALCRIFRHLVAVDAGPILNVDLGPVG